MLQVRTPLRCGRVVPSTSLKRAVRQSSTLAVMQFPPWSLLPLATRCRRARLTHLLTDSLLPDSWISPFSCFLNTVVNPIITSWIQGDWRGNPPLHLLKITSELHKTQERQMRKGYPHKFDFYSICKISTSAVSVAGECSRQERKHNLKFSWKTLAQQWLCFIATGILFRFWFCFTLGSCSCILESEHAMNTCFLPLPLCEGLPHLFFLENILKQKCLSWFQLG